MPPELSRCGDLGMGCEGDPEWGPELVRRRVGTDALTAATAGYNVCAGPWVPEREMVVVVLSWR